MTLEDKIRVGKELFAQKEHCGINDVDISFGNMTYTISGGEMYFGGNYIFEEKDCYFVPIQIHTIIDGSYNIVFYEKELQNFEDQELLNLIFGGLDSPLRIQPETTQYAYMCEFIFFKQMFAFAINPQEAGSALVAMTYIKFKRK